MTDYLAAYLAGFFDGEGSVYIARRIRKGTYQYELGLSLCNTDINTLESIRDSLGFGHIHIQHHQNGKWKSLAQLLFTSRNEQRKFIDLIKPHVRIKAVQLSIAEWFLTTRRQSVGERIDERSRIIRENCWSQLKFLNKRGPRAEAA